MLAYASAKLPVLYQDGVLAFPLKAPQYASAAVLMMKNYGRTDEIEKEVLLVLENSDTT